jgi:outer membrane immunogenic protein
VKNIALISIALIGFSSGAVAADLPSRRAPAPMIAAVPAFSWTGFYVGANAGYGWNTDSSVSIPGLGPVDLDGDGFVGGAQVGYNYQIGSFVVGLEADIQRAGFDNVREVAFPDPLTGTVVRINDNLDWFGTVRARAGVAFDRVLVYATAGLSYSGGEDDTFGTLAADDDLSIGWVLGAGVEYAVTNNLTAGIEGLWVNTGREISAITIVEPGIPHVVRSDNDHDFFVARAKLSFRFGT